ncbi:MAG: hypothetical protein ACP5HM_10320 [Anaerolineae bacterium]
MRNKFSSVILGLLLVLGGVIFLLMNFNLIPSAQPLIWASLFGLGGVGFLSYLFTGRGQWWPIIPGLTLLGLSALFVVETLFPALGDTLGAAIFMGAIGLAFWLIYLITGGTEWWAIIPGGVLFTLTAVILLSEGVFAATAGDELTGGVFMLGLGLTFALLYLLPTGEGHQRWALIPAGVLVLIGLIIAAASAEILAFVTPVVLILVGVYLMLRSLRHKTPS